MSNVSASVQKIGTRYILQDLLGQGGMGMVYRAYDRLTGQHVALKHVTLQKENLQFATRATGLNVEVALAQEFQTLASLRHPYIISVLDYGFDENLQPYFTMELLENAQDIIRAGNQRSEDEQVLLLVQVLQALAYLHRRGIIHRDLKPDNVMVINGQVKVLDFGLAIAQEYLKTATDVIAGTLAYIAPEVLQGHPASMASDLYAVGVIAYELFAERYPFDIKDVTGLINDIMFTMPDVAALGLSPLLESVVFKLLTKDPADRYHDARALIRLYGEATEQVVPFETDSIRESFLQAARFVGREAEMEQFGAAMQQVRQGAGSTWLIGGESGVGKSRLMEEMRTQALVQGALAVRGGAVSDGGAPYQVWREPLRRLVLETDLPDAEAGILKPLIPDISRLLERPIPDPAEIDPQAAQDRLIAAVESLLRRQSQPLAIFLEDLHWAGSESLVMLDRLSQISDLPVFIAGNYRDEEAPALPASLPNAKPIKLERLGDISIQKLSESMLGEAGRRPEVLELLQRETEGNVLFIVEVVRTLAEEAGQLELVGTISLPDTIFVGGIDNLIQRRLQHVPPHAFPLLQCAAIIGRQIDLALLRQIDPQINETSWLTACSDAAVLEVQDDRWRFAHDKFREALLRNLPAEHRQQLHQQAATAIEAVYAEQLSAYLPVLAHHWTQAKVISKAIEYLEKAGEQALQNFANEEALEMFNLALDLAAEPGTSVEPMRRARWLRQIGQAYWGTGDLAALRQHVEEAMRLHNRPIPDSPGSLNKALLSQLMIQIRHRIATPSQIQENQALRLELVRAYKLLGQAYFFQNEANLTVYVTLQQLNLSERIAPSPELAEAYANMCLVSGLVPMHGLARTYEKRGIAIAEALNNSDMIAQVASVVSLYHLGIGEWDIARQHIHRSTTIADAIGDRRLWESVTGVLALTYSFQGDFEQARAIFGDVYRSSRRSSNTQTLLWGMLGQAENLLPSGDFDEAQVFVDEAKNIPIHKFGRDSEMRASALTALVSLRQGDIEQALQAAAIAYELMTLSPPTASWLMRHYAAVAEIYLAMWETRPEHPDYLLFQQRARQMCKLLQRFARTFPIGKPRAALYQGWLNRIENKSTQAQRIWTEAIPAARSLDMPYEEAILHLEVGRNDPLQAAHLQQALEIFERLGAAFNASRARAAMLSAGQS